MVRAQLALGALVLLALAAAWYFAAGPEEVDGWVAGNRAVSDREFELARRGRGLLG